MADQKEDLVEVEMESTHANPKVQIDHGETHHQQDLRDYNHHDSERHLAKKGEHSPVMKSSTQYCLAPPSTHSGVHPSSITTFMAFEVAMIVLYFLFVDYSPEAKKGHDPADLKIQQNSYAYFQDVQVMIFVGFGFLMVFLRRNGFMSVGMTFLVSAMVIQWYLLVDGFWKNVFASSSTWEGIHLDIFHLIRANFCAGAVMISYGGLLGKITPTQLLVLGVSEAFFFALNERISLEMKIADIGGSMVIHLFGAVFGLVSSLVLTKRTAQGRVDNSSVYHSDIMAMVGTLFLWLFWPSFNAALGVDVQQHRAVINTSISIVASCVSAFIASSFFRGGKFYMIDIQNASLAGGVALGTSADMMISPGGSFLVGAIAGWISVYGFAKLSPFLERKFGLHDTCGILNLHGMPSFLGAVAGVIASHRASIDDYGSSLSLTFVARDDGLGGPRTADEQARLQLAFAFITIGIAAGSALLTSWVLFRSSVFKNLSYESTFQDEDFFEVPEKEIPYYFDKHSTSEKTQHDEIQDMRRRLEIFEARLTSMDVSTHV